MTQIKYVNENLKNSLIGVFTQSTMSLGKNKILYCKSKPIISYGIIGYVVPKGCGFKTEKPILEIEEIPPFDDGDIIIISVNGFISLVWEKNTKHHVLYVTDVCNSKCIMCPQVDGYDSHYSDCFKILDIVDLSDVEYIGITGGEPTLEIDNLVKLLQKIAQKKSNIHVHVLTNGRNFSAVTNVEKLTNVLNLQLSFGIPLFSDNAEEHDYIVGVKGAFIETVVGIYNLAKFGQTIEIRTVLMRHNYRTLPRLAEYIYRNFPFVFHVALMAMEYHGRAETNFNTVRIDPIEYQNELVQAIRSYVRYGIDVDIYNLPLCLAKKGIRQFCRDSISTWKKAYLPVCEKCDDREICSGVFGTSMYQSSNIDPILHK